MSKKQSKPQPPKLEILDFLLNPFLCLAFLAAVAVACGLLIDLGFKTGSTIAWCGATSLGTVGLITPFIVTWIKRREERHFQGFMVHMDRTDRTDRDQPQE
jgi:hypothetical protein